MFAIQDDEDDDDDGKVTMVESIAIMEYRELPQGQALLLALQVTVKACP